MQYVGGAEEAAPECLFCELASQDQDEKNLVLRRGRHAFSLLNLYPYNSGHLMVAPYLHTADLVGLPFEVAADLLALTQQAVAALSAEYRPEGFNIGMNLGRAAGAGIPDHLHVHVVPRWGGDTNFMPLTAGTKVLPEALGRTWERLRAAWKG
jgi:ATP adenylyltransferase